MLRRSAPWIGLFGLSLYIISHASCGADSSSPPVCNASNCSGCCTTTGTCAPGDTNTQCGTGGEACVACQSGSCKSGRCATCDPSSCPDGCCQGEECLPGDQPSACGASGMPCRECQPDQTCDNGNCTSVTQCDATSCPDGCCDGDQCQPGDTDAACGKGGAACITCQPPDTTCVDQSCGAGSCNAATCADGCCNAHDQCLPGNIESACGKGGEPCQECPQGDECTNQECGPPGGCGPSNCPNGCCEGSSCEPGNDVKACGTGGAKCEVCTGSQKCANGKCTSDPKSKWEVKVVSGVIEAPPIGKNWDPDAVIPLYEPPDCFVKVTAGSASGKTGTKDNTYSPQWNDTVFTTTTQNLLGPMLIQVYDEELIAAPTLMGQCTVNLTQNDLNAGLYNVLNCGSYDVKVINLNFIAK